jgi:hypothetical protein
MGLTLCERGDTIEPVFQENKYTSQLQLEHFFQLIPKHSF